MKKLILATVLAGIATSALAADLGARTYSKAPVMVEQVYNWTGFYIGGGYWRGKCGPQLHLELLAAQSLPGFGE